MPLCGFNDKMFDGLTQYNLGLIKNIFEEEKKMPVCGFNDKMLEGINDFNEGLVEHGLEYRGKQNGETISQGINRELSDMLRLGPELSRIENVPKRVITQGLVTYAQGFYLLMREKGLANNPDQYKHFIQEVNQYFKAMDEKYYGELEGKPDDMKQLATYLNKLNI